ncbi:hypothetical protein SAMN05192539_1002107 [Paraburkholderia diazotrophica]|uniref:Uncharacterized protein n=1 Tax=Paraburkholderia diazotrophica TaxID=667676 RepID=A0A1H6R5U5_9BURK|nr:hypothetical protein SAMN05192539_1002107 [Paraburkholderia diazotrophica]
MLRCVIRFRYYPEIALTRALWSGSRHPTTTGKRPSLGRGPMPDAVGETRRATPATVGSRAQDPVPYHPSSALQPRRSRPFRRIE